MTSPAAAKTLSANKLKKTRVVIFDERKVARDGLKCMLEKESDLEIIGSIEKREEILSYLRMSKPEILILPDHHFFLALKALGSKDIRRGTQIIMITAPDNIFCRQMAARGITGIVLATSGRIELLSAVRCAAMKKKFIDPSMPAEESAEFLKLKQLSARELDILYLIARGCENSKIAEIMYISGRTVKNHTSHLLKKLNLESRTQAAVYAWKNHIATLPPDVLGTILKK